MPNPTCPYRQLISDWLLPTYLIAAPAAAVFWFENNSGAAVLGAIGVSAIILTRLPDIQTISLFGLRAQLVRSVQEVEIKIQQLRRLSVSLAEPLILQLTSFGESRKSLSIEDRFRVRDEIVNTLKEIGIENQEILRIHREWIDRFCGLILFGIHSRINQLNINPDVRDRYFDQLLVHARSRAITSSKLPFLNLESRTVDLMSSRLHIEAYKRREIPLIHLSSP